MSALNFRIDHAFRDARNAPRRRRSSLLRIAAGILGVAVLALLVFFSVFVGAAMQRRPTRRHAAVPCSS